MSQSQQLMNDLICRLAEQKEWEEAAQTLMGQHPADVAAALVPLPRESRARIFRHLDEDQKPDVVAELGTEIAAEILESFSNDEVSDIVEEMAPDDAADVLADLSGDRSEEVLRLMEADESTEVRDLLRYDAETAGGIMTPDVLAFTGDLPVARAIEQISDFESDEPVYNLYTVDGAGRLTGVIALWDLLRMKDRSRPIGEVARTDVVSASTGMDQEEVARLMSKYDLPSLPVVDRNRKLVGRVTVDDVMDVVQEEASQDIFRLAGSHETELRSASTLDALRSRLPWLVVTLLITSVSSLILKRFMLSLSEVIALSFFVPIVMAMCGSTGMQSSTLVIRSIALQGFEAAGTGRLLLKEVRAGALMGAFCGLLMAAWVRFVVSLVPEQASAYPPLFLGLTAGSALLLAMTFAAMYGAFVPVVLHRCKVDPAVASGPFVTASNDIIALMIYYLVTMGAVSLLRSCAG